MSFFHPERVGAQHLGDVAAEDAVSRRHVRLVVLQTNAEKSPAVRSAWGSARQQTFKILELVELELEKTRSQYLDIYI